MKTLETLNKKEKINALFSLGYIFSFLIFVLSIMSAIWISWSLFIKLFLTGLVIFLSTAVLILWNNWSFKQNLK